MDTRRNVFSNCPPPDPYRSASPTLALLFFACYSPKNMSSEGVAVVEDMQTKDLLRAAEVQIVQMQKDLQGQDAFVNELMEAQKLEAAELVRLTEQVWKLEAALEDVSAERDDIRLLLMGLREDMVKIRDVAAETLKSATDKNSLLNMAVKFYDVKTLADSVRFIKND